MGARTPTRGGRYVALHTRMLGDTDLLVLSVEARCLWPLLLLHSADQGLGGRVPADPRRVELVAHLGSVDTTRRALDELLDGRFLIPDEDDPAWLIIRSWAKNQASFLGEAEPEPGSKRSIGQLRRAHRAGSHAAEARPGCPECEADGDRAQCATGDAQETPTLTVVPDAPADEPEPAPARAAKPGGMSEVLEDLRVSLDAAVAEAETPVAAYREALETADAIAQHPEVASRSKDARSSLRNAVLAHALIYYLGDAASRAVIGAANRGAKALGPDGHWWYVVAAAKAAGRSFESERKLTGWLATVAQGERAERKAVA
jgi:hypothetical protein